MKFTNKKSKAIGSTKYFKFYFFLIFSLLMQTKQLFAQNELDAKAPTLQIGLDGFSFEKGTLDAQLIMEIVAQKQQELKIKAVQNVFLSKVKDAGGTIYSFTDNVVRELVFEKDQNVRTKKILENTVNFVFVCSYLDYFLSTLSETEIVNLKKLAKNYGYKDNELGTQFTLKSFIKEKRKNSSDYYSDDRAIEFLTLLLDMCSEVVHQDDKLKQLGLMQISYSATYDYVNRYNRLITDSCEQKTIKPNWIKRQVLNNTEIAMLEINSIDCRDIVTNAQSLFNNMKEHLSNITNYIGLVNYIIDQYSFRNDNLELFKKSVIGVKDVAFSSDDENFKTIKSDLENLIKELIDKKTNDSTLIKEINNLTQIYFYVDKAAKQLQSNEINSKVVADILYTFYAEFVPILKKQGYRSEKNLKIIECFNTVCNSLAEQLTNQNEQLKKLKEKSNSFLIIASKLYQFNKASTISEYLKSIEEIGNVLPDDDIKSALSTVISFVKDYTVIEKNEKGKDIINFNVESFIVKLQNIKPYKLSRWQFNLTVGVNNAYFQKDLVMQDSSITRNLSYVSEKIGIKYKFFDRSFWKTRNPGETYMMKTLRHPLKGTSYVKNSPPIEPLISNMHALVYGSGLLYNLVNTKTNKEFNMPMVGAGIGLTFYNALDFNICYGVPIFPNSDFQKSINNNFINIGFDIQFLEYYNRLQEKRKANQTQKQISKAKEYN